MGCFVGVFWGGGAGGGLFLSNSLLTASNFINFMYEIVKKKSVQSKAHEKFPKKTFGGGGYFLMKMTIKYPKNALKMLLKNP